MIRWLVVALALLLAAPAAALAAPEPVISYVHVDVNGKGTFRLYDEQTETEVEPPPPVPIPANPAAFRYGMSLDGRFIAYTDGDRKIHLLDRATNGELPLPGIDLYSGDPQGPQSLSVSNTGLIAFHQVGDQHAVVYDSAAKSFVDTGLPSPNGHRQTHLSGDGRFLITTCVDPCVATTTDGADTFIQDLSSRTDQSFPYDNLRDEEHPCINGDGSVVGYDKQRNPPTEMKTDVFLFHRSGSTLTPIDISNANAAANAEVKCVLDSGGDFVGLFNNDTVTFSAFDIALHKFLMLPPDKEFDERSLFSAPYSPPPPGGGNPNPPPPDVTKPSVRRLRMTHRRFRPHRRATAFRFALSETADVNIVIRRRGRRLGAIKRADLAAGANRIFFSGRLRGRKLKPGRYLALLRATDTAGNVSPARSIRFTILPAGGDRRP